MTLREQPVRFAALLLLGVAFAVLLGRAIIRDASPDPARPTAPIYDPVSYYRIVNDEIVDDLRFCPLYADPNQQLIDSESLSRAAELQLELDVPELDGQTSTSPDCANCDAEGRRLNALFCLSPDTVATDQLASRIIRFAEMSPLGEDMSAADRWDHGSEGRVLRLHEGIHQQRIPDPDSVQVLEYRGDLLYRSSITEQLLVDGAGNERILGSGEEPVNLQAWRREQQQTDRDGRLQRTSHALPLELGETATIHEIPDMPDRIALEVRERSGMRVLVDGAPIDQTVRSVLAVDRGQVIEIELDSGEPLRLRLAGQRTGTLSTRRLTADGRRREIDPESGLDDLVISFNAALGGTLRRLNDTWAERRVRRPEHDPTRLADADITLSIDRSLQLQAVDGLHRFAGSPQASHNGKARTPRFHDELWWDGDTPMPFPHMTLTILDADSGELLSMASYPNRQTINAALQQASQLSGGSARLLREQLEQELGRSSLHLRPHAIGSLFKPFIGWAAGRADPELLAFEIDASARRSDWNYANLESNRELTRCMISGRRLQAKDDSHFHNAYPKQEASWHCPGNSSGEDVCGAIAVSDTYWFLELIARVMTRSSGAELPPRGTPDRQRDLAYRLPETCGRQFVYGPDGKRQQTCGDQSGSGQSRRLLPDTCPPGDPRPICMIVDALGVQLQETNHANDPSSASIDAYLGPLAGLVDELAADAPSGCASADKVLLDGFRWAVPLPPQWPQNLMRSCTPDLEAFMEGGGLNYWNDVHIVQTFARLFIDQPQLQARLVIAVDDTQPPGVALGRSVARDCGPEASTARCQILHGLAGALDHNRGTLHALDPVEGRLAKPHADASIDVVLRGKTGTTRAPFPTFVRKPKRGWVHAMVPRKSIHTALLVEVSDADGRARHFVVYLSMNGVDDQLTSRDAAAFFAANAPGFGLLRRLVDDAVMQLEATP